MSKYIDDSASIKREARKDLPYTRSLPLFPFHRPDDSKFIIKYFYEFRAEPSEERFVRFLSVYFKVSRKLIRRHWKAGRWIVLRSAKHRELLFDATVVMSAFYSVQKMPFFIDEIYRNVLPLKNTRELYCFLLQRFIYSFSSKEKLAVLSWIRFYLIELMVLPIELPEIGGETTEILCCKKIEKFMESLGKTKMDIESPYREVHLHVYWQPGIKKEEREVIGKLKLVFELTRIREEKTIEFLVSQQGTFLLAHLILCEQKFAQKSEQNLLDVGERVRISYSELDQWNKQTKAYRGKIETKISEKLIKGLNHFYRAMFNEMKKRFPSLTREDEKQLRRLVGKDSRSVWINSRCRPTLSGDSLVGAEMNPTKRKRKKLPSF